MNTLLLLKYFVDETPLSKEEIQYLLQKFLIEKTEQGYCLSLSGKSFLKNNFT